MPASCGELIPSLSLVGEALGFAAPALRPVVGSAPPVKPHGAAPTIRVPYDGPDLFIGQPR